MVENTEKLSLNTLSIQEEKEGGESHAESIMILYASQGGTSERAAQDFHQQMQSRFPSIPIHNPVALDEFFQAMQEKSSSVTNPSTGTDSATTCNTWTRIVIIFVSSFGLGGAPRGGRKFRSWCDQLLQHRQEQQQKNANGQKDMTSDRSSSSSSLTFLRGLQFALCGQGDSKYKSFQMNPIRTMEALQYAGAEMIGNRGITDSNTQTTTNDEAKQQNRNGGDQKQQIQNWIDSIWEPLSQAIQREPLSIEQLHEMTNATRVLLEKGV